MSVEMRFPSLMKHQLVLVRCHHLNTIPLKTSLSMSVIITHLVVLLKKDSLSQNVLRFGTISKCLKG